MKKNIEGSEPCIKPNPILFGWVINGRRMQMHVKFAHSQACVEGALEGVESCLMSVEIAPAPSSASQ